MAHEIIWTTDALEGIENILEYLQYKWRQSSANQFLDNFETHLYILATYPESGTLEVPEKEIRGAVIHPNTKIFYRVEENRLILLKIFDTRQQTPDL